MILLLLTSSFFFPLEGGCDTAATISKGAEEEAKTRLLHYLLLHKPIDGRAFRKALSVHLDAMLEALVALRGFGIYENGERGTEAAYDNEKAPCHRV